MGHRPGYHVVRKMAVPELPSPNRVLPHVSVDLRVFAPPNTNPVQLRTLIEEAVEELLSLVPPAQGANTTV